MAHPSHARGARLRLGPAPRAADTRAWIAKALDLAALLAFAAAVAALARRTAGLLDDPALLFIPVLAAPLGVLAADLVSGLVHWLADTLFEEDTPVAGALLIRPFREHHRDPLAITRHGFLETNGNSALASLPPLGLLLWLAPAPEGAAALFAHAFAIALALAAAATNQIHKWAHAPSTPAWVAWLQAHRLVLPPEAHARHHRGGGASAYCVTTGWLNPLLDAAGVFRRIEAHLPPARAR